MSTPQKKSSAELLLSILSTTNAVSPIVMTGISAVIAIIKRGRESGKTDAEIEAEAKDSMETALRTRAKSEDQMSDRA